MLYGNSSHREKLSRKNFNPLIFKQDYLVKSLLLCVVLEYISHTKVKGVVYE